MLKSFKLRFNPMHWKIALRAMVPKPQIHEDGGERERARARRTKEEREKKNVQNFFSITVFPLSRSMRIPIVTGLSRRYNRMGYLGARMR